MNPAPVLAATKENGNVKQFDKQWQRSPYDDAYIAERFRQVRNAHGRTCAKQDTNSALTLSMNRPVLALKCNPQIIVVLALHKKFSTAEVSYYNNNNIMVVTSTHTQLYITLYYVIALYMSHTYLRNLLSESVPFFHNC